MICFPGNVAFLPIRSGAMKNAYIEEVEGCKLDLENAKTSLETWYAKRYPEAEIVGMVKD